MKPTVLFCTGLSGTGKSYFIKNILPKGKDILAVIKADAYGHGATMCAPILLASGVKMLGVASIDEGLDLRKAKIKAPILVLGTVPAWAIEIAINNNIQIPLFTEVRKTILSQNHILMLLKILKDLLSL